MTPKQMTRKLAREIKQFYRVQKYFISTIQKRIDNINAIDDPTPKDYQLRDNYFNLIGIHSLAAERVKDMWRRLDLWRTNFPAMPDVFDTDLDSLTEIKLKRMLAANNVLTDDQVNNYVIVDDLFTPPQSGKNRYQRMLEVADATADLYTVFTRRMAWWIAEWGLQGTAPRENQIRAILCEEVDAASLARAVVADLMYNVRNEKGESETTVPELRMRNRFLKDRPVIAGGIHAIKRGTTTATGLPAGPEPDEFDPDIDTDRDEPPMGTDVV